MKTSEKTDKLIPALFSVLPKLGNIKKDAKNDFFKAKYATLNAVLNEVKPALTKGGLFIMQGPGMREDGKISVCTRIFHESGQWIEQTTALPIVKNDPQAGGAAISYARRYSLLGLLCLWQEDDDAESAMNRGKPVPRKKPKAPVKAEKDPLSWRIQGGKSAGTLLAEFSIQQIEKGLASPRARQDLTERDIANMQALVDKFPAEAQPAAESAPKKPGAGKQVPLDEDEIPQEYLASE